MPGITTSQSILTGNDQSVLVIGARGAITRRDIRDAEEELAVILERNRIRRVLVRSDDPGQILLAILASQRVGADLWIIHTTVSDEHYTEIVSECGIEWVLDHGRSCRTPLPGSEANPADSRIHVMTSGTTGRPKIASHTLESILGRLRRLSEVLPDEPPRWLLTYQATTFAGLQVLFTAALSGGSIVYPEAQNPQAFFEAAKRWAATHISGTPTFWRSFLLVAESGSLEVLRQITLGGEAIDQPTLDRLRARFPAARITQIYASTEAGVVLSVHDGQTGFPSAWLESPVGDVALRIRNNTLEVRTAGTVQRSRKSEVGEQAPDGWLSTGDAVEVIGDRVQFLGRQDSMINIGGAKVYPNSVESFLLKLSYVREARVFAVKNPLSGFVVGADLVLSPDAPSENARVEILKACRESLPSYQVPRLLRIVDRVATNTSGKKATA